MMNGGISSSDEESMPRIEMVEHPKGKGYRFRYGCEGKTAGALPGENSTPNRKTVPSFRLVDIPPACPVIVVISCVTAEAPYRPHPHKLVGKECDKGVCTLKMKRATTGLLQHMGIQCVKKKEVETSLNQRDQIKVNPFNGLYYEQDFTYDLKKVRLAIQAFIQDSRTGQHIALEPIVTNIIYDQKAENDLSICRMDKDSSEAKGGQEVFLLCEKVNKDDIQIQFYDDEGWESWGDFAPNDVHKQYAIVFKVPPYRDQNIRAPKMVNMRLYRQSDDSYSDHRPFMYKPNELDQYAVLGKRKRKSSKLNLPGPGPVLPDLAAFNHSTTTNGMTQGQAENNIQQMLLRMFAQQQINNRTSAASTAASTSAVPEVIASTSASMVDASSPAPSTSSNSTPSGIGQDTNSSSPTGVVYPKQSALSSPNTPRLEDLMSLQTTSHSYSNQPTVIPSTVNLLSETRSEQAAPIPTLLPGMIDNVTVIAPITATETNPQDLFTAMTTTDPTLGYLALNGVHNLEGMEEMSLLESTTATEELMKYINTDMLEADDGGNGRKKKTNRRRNTKKK